MKISPLLFRFYVLIRDLCRVLEAFFFLVAANHMLRSRGFGYTHRVFVGHQRFKAPTKRCVAEVVIAQVIRAVKIAALVNPSPAHCLPRSLVIYKMLVRRGFSAAFCIGVGYISLRPHAWVYCNGKSIDTVKDNQHGLILLHPDTGGQVHKVT